MIGATRQRVYLFIVTVVILAGAFIGLATAPYVWDGSGYCNLAAGECPSYTLVSEGW